MVDGHTDTPADGLPGEGGGPASARTVEVYHTGLNLKVHTVHKGTHGIHTSLNLSLFNFFWGWGCSLERYLCSVYDKGLSFFKESFFYGKLFNQADDHVYKY